MRTWSVAGFYFGTRTCPGLFKNPPKPNPVGSGPVGSKICWGGPFDIPDNQDSYYIPFVSNFSLQEAQKRMKIKKPPHILVIHLKRFKYIEHLSRYKKLSYRVVFPLELKLINTVEDTDPEYSLFAVVVHVGSGPNHGHYVSLVKSHNHWLFFDDENVEMIDESAVQTFFGSAQEYSSNTDHGYILFYERVVDGTTS